MYLRYAFGLSPNFNAFSSVIINTADAPSVYMNKITSSLRFHIVWKPQSQLQKVNSNFCSEFYIWLKIILLIRMSIFSYYKAGLLLLKMQVSSKYTVNIIKVISLFYMSYMNINLRIFTKNEALAAVIVPCGLMKAGFNFCICSMVDTRTPLSTATGSASPVK